MKRKFERRELWPEGQLDDERSRVVLEGRRADDGTLCKLIVVHEVGGAWVLYPHGWDKLGVRVPTATAVKMAQTIMDGAQCR